MSDEYKTYRANAEGYDGDKIRVEGEKFTTNIAQGSWMDLLDEDGNVVERPKHAPAPAKGEVVSKGDAGAAEFQKALAARDADIAALRAEIEQMKAGAANAGQAGQPEPGPLDQSIPDLTAYLESVGDVGAVDALIAAEKGGKSRSGALEALEARKAALQGS